MIDATRTTRFRFWLWLICAVGVIVPHRLRGNWRREWEAELRHREELLTQWDRLDWRCKLDLLWRSTSAFWDALWLQPKRLEDEMFQDLRFGARMLLKSKGFTMVAVLSLALGIGANTALFSVMDAVLLKTLPVPEPERLVLFEWQAGLPFRISGMSGTSSENALFRYDVFEKLRAAAQESPLSDFFAFAPIYEGVAVAGDQAEIIKGQAVSGGYYTGLGAQPILGRAITYEDDKPGAAPVAVLSHQFWQERFGADPAVIGQQLKLNKQSFTIIGVTPPAFTGTLQVGYYPAVTVPIACEPLLRGEESRLGTANEPGSWCLHLMGRLKPGATYEQSRESLNGAFQSAALEVMPPPTRADEPAQLDPKDYPRLVAQSGSRGMLDDRREYSATIYVLFIVVALVLLIACANVANLLLARAALRGSEISVRLAVGAGRWRLIRQLLTESVLLAALSGAAGLLFAFWGKRAILALTDKDSGFLPNGVDISLNWRVLAFTVAVSLLTGVLFGLAPAWRSTSQDLTTALKQSRRTTGAVSRLSKGLIVAQVALSLLILVGAGLFIRTLYNLQHVNLGFNQENLLIFKLRPDQGGYKDERLLQFYQRLFDRLDNLPGVRAATFQRTPLIANDNSANTFLLPGETEMTAIQRGTSRQTARENYFATMEIPLLRGRGDEAKKQGLRTRDAFRDAVPAATLAGCAQIEHGLGATDDDLKLMAEKGTYLDPQGGALLENYLLNRARYAGRPYFPKTETEMVVANQKVLPLHHDLLRRASKVKGLKIVFGSDALAGMHGRNAEEFIHRVRDCGVDLMTALVSANSLAAEALGLADQIGSLAPDLQADIIALDGDPLKDITAVRRVVFVMKGGNVYKHAVRGATS